MARKARQINDLVIDEISLVDKGANQHAVVTIAKSADGETEEKMDIYDEAGNPLDVDALEDGDVVYDAEGSAYEFTLEEEEEREPELVGKSATNPFAREPRVEEPVSKNFVSNLREELSKALTDKDRDEVITKAFGTIETLAQQVSKAEEIAKSERQVRLQREYTEVAKSYGLPFQDEVLGGVLMRCAESLSREDCEVIAKCLEAAGEAVYMEKGNVGGGDNSDVLAQVNGFVSEQVSKGMGDFSEEELASEVFASHPELYDEYLSEK